MNFKRIFQLCKKAAIAWVDDFAPSMGAAISYYTVFSLAPLLIIMIAIAGALFGREAVQGQIVAQLSGLIGPSRLIWQTRKRRLPRLVPIWIKKPAGCSTGSCC